VIATPDKRDMLFNTAFLAKFKAADPKTAKYSKEREIVRVSSTAIPCRFVVPVQYIKMLEGLPRSVTDHLFNTAGLRIKT
jgi:hypothetical protein